MVFTFPLLPDSWGNAASALPLIIFITGLPERMPDAFGVRAFQFLVKPIDEKQFGLVFDQAKKAVFCVTKGSKVKSLFVSFGGLKRTVLIPDIRFIESMRIGMDGLNSFLTMKSLNKSCFCLRRVFAPRALQASTGFCGLLQASAGFCRLLQVFPAKVFYSFF